MSVVKETKARRLRLSRSSNGMLMTPEEFDAVTCYDRRFAYELIRGILIVSPAPGESERDPNEETRLPATHLPRQTSQWVNTRQDAVATLYQRARWPPQGRSRDLGGSWPRAQSSEGRAGDRGRIRLEAKPRPHAKSRRKTSRLRGQSDFRILGHQSIRQDHDGLSRIRSG